MDMGLDHLKELQEADGILAGVRAMAMEGAEGYFNRDGVIYRQWQRPGEGSAVDQIVLPHDYREKVLELAQTIPEEDSRSSGAALLLAYGVPRCGKVLCEALLQGGNTERDPDRPGS